MGCWTKISAILKKINLTFEPLNAFPIFKKVKWSEFNFLHIEQPSELLRGLPRFMRCYIDTLLNMGFQVIFRSATSELPSMAGVHIFKSSHTLQLAQLLCECVQTIENSPPPPSDYIYISTGLHICYFCKQISHANLDISFPLF